ncbi:hypothetical protein CCP3SC1AL1_990001 [Gammaproteobacteria bacterium]
MEVVRYNKSSVLYKTTIDDLHKYYKCINWNKNRKPDSIRIDNISSYYKVNNITTIPGIVSGWLHDNNIVEIYDGIHRFLASHSESNTSTNREILIKLTSTVNESEIIEDFTNINRSVSVPVLYLEQNNYEKRAICEKVVTYYCEKYKAHVSPSRNCQRQNFNRDNFIDMIASLNIDFSTKNLENVIIQHINGINMYAKSYIDRNKIIVPNKCRYNGFYMFYLEYKYIRDRLENDINNDN